MNKRQKLKKLKKEIFKNLYNTNLEDLYSEDSIEDEMVAFELMDKYIMVKKNMSAEEYYAKDVQEVELPKFVEKFLAKFTK